MIKVPRVDGGLQVAKTQTFSHEQAWKCSNLYVGICSFHLQDSDVWWEISDPAFTLISHVKPRAIPGWASLHDEPLRERFVWYMLPEARAAGLFLPMLIENVFFRVTIVLCSTQTLRALMWVLTLHNLCPNDHVQVFKSMASPPATCGLDYDPSVRWSIKAHFSLAHFSKAEIWLDYSWFRILALSLYAFSQVSA